MRTVAFSLLLVALAACGTSEQKPAEPTPEQPAAEEPATEATPAATADATPSDARRVTITIDKNGYAPAEITAQPNEKLLLVFDRKDEENCGGEVVFPSTGEKKTVAVGTPTEVTVTAPASGKLEFTCGMNMYKGAVVVNG